MDRALLALIALMLNAMLGGPRQWYIATGISGLARLPVRTLRELERKLNREQRSESERRVRGMVLVGSVLAACVLLGWFFGWLFQSNLRFLELFLLTAALPLRPTFDRVAGIRAALFKNDLTLAQRELEGTVWRHHAMMDEHAVARAGVELLAVQFAEKIVSPIFWYLIFGLPGLLFVKAITFMQENLPVAPPSARVFSQATAQLHEMLHYLPARLASLFWLVVSVLLPSGNIGEAASGIWKSWSQAPHSQALALVSASAALKVSLGGPGSPYVREAWVENGPARILAGDVKRALWAFGLLQLVFFIFLGIFV